ncbi:LlaJI family restriction endonuclease [Xenorhabdus bovienii]|uniref:LlaJI family restriction endonuclease n=1 Tax=Xenorhabdus bovienii TaxID=40576 RepID=UPI00237CFB6C|nr:LlaJI family restriction endonuclease [Xenorhabdus bovienii]MDE1486564.1 LlaJI family restriction endonuclease [Xenorhabdus bovienii]MDE1496056.1 LlaJI family restriction endonuclease [Xenorhabdus bovienii]MDE9446598.1 LlaJI family restriction endonuclease [Xenorhabdus bovienii]MDE9474084.1 LlaJI family restriction endonuclease [Xenorhabdus bovienii]MDE9477184.1 LlaJI family restriction endonuclease [Xenorhabdus bovienii]
MKNSPDFHFSFFNDRHSVNELPDSLFDSLKFNGLIPPGSMNIHFCGLVSYEGKTAIFLPRNSKVKDDADKEEIARSLLRSIHRYKQTADSATETADEGNDIIGSDSLSLIISLINDYTVNGLYSRRIRFTVRNNGKADWKKTISRMPSFVVGDDIFYPEIYGTKNRTVHDCDISRIHAQVIRELCLSVGWIDFLDPSVAVQALVHIPPPFISKEAQIILLMQELHITYSDRDIFLLKNLIQYLRKGSGNINNNMVIGIRECHGLWERMLDACLLYTEKVNHRLTAPVYKISGDYILASFKGHRTDTVLRHPDENKYVIVDAKYYGARSVVTAPKLADIVKQFYYAKAMKIVESSAESVINVFVFPGSKGNIESVHMAPRGLKRKYREEDCLDNDYPPILCLYQDPVELLSQYSRSKPLDKLSEKIINLSLTDNQSSGVDL